MRLLYMALFISGVSFAQSVKETVYFDYNSHVLTTQESQKLDKLNALADTVIVRSVAIRAFCDDRGSYGYNHALSARRAGTVATFLKPRFKHAMAGGEIALVPGDTLAQRNRNRRAEIVLEYTLRPKAYAAAIPKPDSVHPVVNDSALTAETTEPIEYRRIDERDFLPGDRILLKNIQFISGRSVLIKRSERELINILLFMQRNPNVIVEIQGHVCCIADNHKDAVDEDTYTPNLSENRAKKIYDYLIKKGIPAQRMAYKGYGRQYPIPGGWEEENKRVEILVTGMLDD